jgi:hypothetical protein
MPVRRGALPARRLPPRDAYDLPLPHVPEGDRLALRGVRGGPACDALGVHPRRAEAPQRLAEIAERGFRAECGTPLTYRGAEVAKRASVTICSLDDPERRRADRVPARRPNSAVGWVRDCLGQAPYESLGDWLKSKAIADVGSRQRPDHD